jgi:hypothetical protein
VSSGADKPDKTRRHRSTGLGIDPVIVILALAGIVDGLAGNPVHAFLLVGVAVLLGSGIDVHLRSASIGEKAGEQRPIMALTFAIVYAVVIGGFDRYSWPATFAVVVPGVVGLLVAFQRAQSPGPESAPIGRVGAIAWAAVFVSLGLWELANLLLQPDLVTGSYAHPTLSTLLDPVLAVHSGRSALLLAWLGLGWYLARR